MKNFQRPSDGVLPNEKNPAPFGGRRRQFESRLALFAQKFALQKFPAFFWMVDEGGLVLHQKILRPMDGGEGNLLCLLVGRHDHMPPLTAEKLPNIHPLRRFNFPFS